MEVLRKIGYVLLGVILAVAIFCAVIGVGCAVNGLTFGEQITSWFGSNAPVVDEVVNDAVETASMLKPII